MTPPEDENEIALLRQRVAELSEAKQRLQETNEHFSRLVDATNAVVSITENGVFCELSGLVQATFGYEPEELIGRRVIDVVAPEARERVAKGMETGVEELYETICIRKDGSTFLAETCARGIHRQGRPARVAVIRDISVQRRTEEAAQAALVQQEVIRAQEAALSELSTPLLPISKDILVLPLIGSVNTQRAVQVIEGLVRGVAKNRARTGILDITGVPDVDTDVADALLHAARAVELLGAQVILTGVRPEVAQRFVELGTDFSRIIICGTLEAGVAHALRHSRAGSRRRLAPESARGAGRARPARSSRGEP